VSLKPTAISALKLRKQRKVFAETAGAVVLVAMVVAFIGAVYLGLLFAVFHAIKFVWATYPLNYWQTVVGVFLIAFVANLVAAPFRRKSEPE
jgi:hypothetical protein